MSRYKIKWIVGFIILIFLAIIYKTYHPLQNIYFPKCPFLVLTGYKCPGCGSQRAIHYLLNLDIPNAFSNNMILVLFIPYIIIELLFRGVKNPSDSLLKWRKILFGPKAIYIVLAIIISFWILRNTVFPSW